MELCCLYGILLNETTTCTCEDLETDPDACAGMWCKYCHETCAEGAENAPCDGEGGEVGYWMRTEKAIESREEEGGDENGEGVDC